jgi:hypothetical protein
MKKTRLILVFLFLAFFMLPGEISLTKEAAIELLEPGWEYRKYTVESPMVFYLLKMEELSWKTINELEYILSWEDNVEEEEWQLFADQEVISSIWSDLQLDLVNFQEGRQVRNDYSSWLITVPNKEGIIRVNNTLLNDKNRESPAYFSILLKPLELTISEEKILTAVELEYKNKSGNVASVETEVWLAGKSTEPVFILKQLQEGKKENQYRYFALFIEARSLYPEMLRGTAPILVMNNIKGINQLFSLDKLIESKSQIAFYLGNTGGGVEYKRDTGGEKLKLALFSNDGTLNYQAVFDKSFNEKNELLGSVLIEKKAEPYLMLGLRDSINCSADFKWQLSFYPLVYDLNDFNRQEPVTEIQLSYEKKAFGISYIGSHWNSEITNTIKIDYELTPLINLSLVWQEEDYYLGLIYNK